jgi:hypothetical protein
MTFRLPTADCLDAISQALRLEARHLVEIAPPVNGRYARQLVHQGPAQST